MKKKIWDIYAPIYKLVMKSDRKAYSQMYQRLEQIVRGKDALELATGPGLLAKNIAVGAASFIATDYSEGMIREAKKGECPKNLIFEVADATALPYENARFDIVIIANALHIMPSPETALKEIRRVLRPGGILVCPNFIDHKGSFFNSLWNKILSIAGVKFEHQWDVEEYKDFIVENGWIIDYEEYMPARIPILYLECH